MDETPPPRDPRSAPLVKICGLREEALIDVAIARGAGEIGLIHFRSSPRHLPLDRISGLVRHVARRVRTVVVTVDPDDATLDELAAHARPDILQLHGRETPERLAAIQRATGLPLMKAVSVGPTGPMLAIAAYAGVADRILLDAKAPKGSALPGGNGVSFDWTLLERIEALRGTPYMLSGGIDAANVEVALRTARPFGIDISSGVETAPGLKSADLIHRFFDAFHAATLTDAGRQAP